MQGVLNVTSGVKSVQMEIAPRLVFLESISTEISGSSHVPLGANIR